MKLKKYVFVLTFAVGCAAAFVGCDKVDLAGVRSVVASKDGARPIVVAPKNGELEVPVGRKAFLVAADDYGDKAPSLPGAKKDVEALSKKLVEIGFEERDVVVLKTGETDDKRPTQSAIARRFAEFVDNLNEGDFVIVYLSGHGIQSPSGEAFFAPTDVDLKDLFGTSVSIKEMARALKKSAASFRWIIVDACREDPSNPGAARSPFQLARSATARALTDPLDVPDSVLLLQSCEPGNLSYEGGRGRAKHLENGLFTLSLLEALDENKSKADANDDGVLAFSELFTYVSARTKKMAYEYYDATQKPCLSGFATDFALMTIGDVTPRDREKAKELYAEAQGLRGEKKWEAALAKIRDARERNPENEEYRVAEAEVEQLIVESKPPVVVKDDDDDDKIDELKQMISELQQKRFSTPQAQWNAAAWAPEQTASLAGRAQTDIGALTPAQLLQLGCAYYLGDGVPQNPTMAFRCFERAAALGEAIAIYNLGVFYQLGYGVPQNPTMAFRCYERAAALGNTIAMFNLSLCYGNGFGVPQNPTMAFRCCEQAAITGFPQAMYLVGCCYATGYGVFFPDNRKAIYWYNLAATSADANVAQTARAALNQMGIRTF